MSKKLSNFDETLFSLTALAAGSFAVVSAAMVGVLYAVPYKEENKTVLVEAFDESRNKVSAINGYSFETYSSDMDPGVYQCDVTGPMARRFFPFSSFVPADIYSVSGCESVEHS